MKSAVRQMSPAKVNRLYEQAKIKGSAYFTLPATGRIVFTRNACLIDGYIYGDAIIGNTYTAFRVDTVAGNNAQPAFIPSNSHVSPF